MNVRTIARNRKIPAVHQVTLVNSVVACRPPMIVSVPAPPPIVASPPPCPAWSSTAVARIRTTTRIVYMRGARYLGYAGAHKFGPAVRVERRATDQHAVQLALGEQVGGVLQIDASPVQDPGLSRLPVLEPAANRAVHV